MRSLIETTQDCLQTAGSHGRLALWFTFAKLISQKYILRKKTKNKTKKNQTKSRVNKAGDGLVVPPILIKEQLRAELGNQSLTQTRKLRSVRSERRW